MGCGATMPKDPAVFLAKEQPAPSSYLYDGLPKDECLKMTAWKTGPYYAKDTVGNNKIDCIQMPEVAEESRRADLEHFQVDHSGMGQPEKVFISNASGTQLATMTMPPPKAFGFAAVLRDAEEKVIALVATAQTSRPHGFGGNSVNIWGVKPNEGQAPTVVAGINCYLWARAERPKVKMGKFGPTTFHNATGMAIAKGVNSHRRPYEYKFMTPGGDGLMLATFPSDIPKKEGTTFNIQCAKGVDATLMICMLAAFQLAHDEESEYISSE